MCALNVLYVNLRVAVQSRPIICGHYSRNELMPDTPGGCRFTPQSIYTACKPDFILSHLTIMRHSFTSNPCVTPEVFTIRTASLSLAHQATPVFEPQEVHPTALLLVITAKCSGHSRIYLETYFFKAFKVGFLTLNFFEFT